MQWVTWVFSPGVRRSVCETGHLLSFKFRMRGVIPPLHHWPSRANRDNLTFKYYFVIPCFYLRDRHRDVHNLCFLCGTTAQLDPKTPLSWGFYITHN
jgi:hypothetical protein